MNSTNLTIALAITLLLVGCNFKTIAPTTLVELNEKNSQMFFNYIDQNKNSKISKDEFIAFEQEKDKLQQQKAIEQMIESCDTNGDKQISLDEIPKRNPYPTNFRNAKRPCFINERMFSRQDANHDNILTAEELSMKRPMPLPAPVYGRTPVSAPLPVENRVKEMEVFLGNKFNACDVNGDKKLTLLEATASKCRIPSDEFTKADSNSDSFLVLQEIIDMAKKEDKKRVVATPVVYPYLPDTAPIEVRLIISMAKCDSNRDGKLTEDEIVAPTCGFTKKDLEDSDYNSDGVFSGEDMAVKNILRHFKRLDKNSDGVLDFEEFINSPVGVYVL